MSVCCVGILLSFHLFTASLQSFLMRVLLPILLSYKDYNHDIQLPIELQWDFSKSPTLCGYGYDLFRLTLLLIFFFPEVFVLH